MGFKSIGTFIRNAANKVGFWGKKNAPELLIVSGVILIGASVATAIASTLKLEEKVLKPANVKIDLIHKRMDEENERAIADANYVSEYNGKKELAKAYALTALNVGKLYLPTILCFGLSVASVLTSHHISKARELAAAAAYTAVNNAYNEYRKRVQEKIGKNAEYDIYHNVQEEEKEEVEVDKKGKEKVVTKKVKVETEHDPLHEYLFDESNKNWVNNANYNFEFLCSMQKALNFKLEAKGYLMMEDVYKALGVDPATLTPEQLMSAKIIGWVYDKDAYSDPDKRGDNYVSFGLFDEYGELTPAGQRMKYECEPSVWLEFNPDGDILHSDLKDSYMKHAKAW